MSDSKNSDAATPDTAQPLPRIVYDDVDRFKPSVAANTDPNAAAWVSCRAGDFRAFLEQLRGCPTLIAARDKDGHSAMHWFALNNNTEAIKKLLGLGAELDCRSDNFQTPFMWAVIQGHVELCVYLLDQGADMEARDSLGATPLTLAVQHSQLLVLLLLLERGANATAGDIKGATAVHWAAFKGDVVCGKMLHRHGVDMHKFDNEGYNALHRACRAGKTEFCKYLLDNLDFDVDCRAKDVPGRKGLTGMEMAIECGQEEVARLCGEYRARKHAGDSGLAKLWHTLSERYSGGSVSPLSRHRNAWCACVFLSTIVYLFSILPDSAESVTDTMFMLFYISLLAFVYYRLLNTDPGALDPHGMLGQSKGYAGVTSAFGRRAAVRVCQQLMEETSDIAEKGERLEAICFLCEIVKPPRSSHCSHCDRCFDRRDAHVDVLGCCVAKQNHRLFLLWALLHCATSTLFLILALGVCGSIYSRAETLPGFLLSLLFRHTALTLSFAFQLYALVFCSRILRTQYKHIAANLTVEESSTLSVQKHFWEVYVSHGRAVRSFRNPFDQGSKLDNVREFLGLVPPIQSSARSLRHRPAAEVKSGPESARSRGGAGVAAEVTQSDGAFDTKVSVKGPE